MSEMKIEFETAKGSMDEVRPALDDALHAEFPGGMLSRTWDGDVLQLSGPGAQGTIRLDGGKLVGEAKLGPPASLMKDMIEKKISSAMRKAAE